MKLFGPFAIACFTALLLLSGCASMKHDLQKSDTVNLETVPVEEVTYLYTNIWQKGVKTYISGRYALKDPATVRNVPAHLDMSIFDADSKPLLIYYTPYKQYHIASRGNQVQFFTASILQLAEGSRVLLKHHFAEMAVHDVN